MSRVKGELGVERKKAGTPRPVRWADVRAARLRPMDDADELRVEAGARGRARDGAADDALTAIGLLDEPVRRRVYEWVVAAGRPVARDEVAAGVGIGRPLAAFHLDRLAAAGLLAVEYHRRTGRSGPGAGRPAKFYRRAAREVRVSLPERRYDLIAELLAEAVEATATVVPPPELIAAAREAGRQVGTAARARPVTDGHPVGATVPVEPLGELLPVLAAHGYEPSRVGDDALTLRNCPFDALVPRHRDLVCGTNLAFAEGLLEGLRIDGVAARLEPGTDRCCVLFEIRGNPPGPPRVGTLGHPR